MTEMGLENKAYNFVVLLEVVLTESTFLKTMRNCFERFNQS